MANPIERALARFDGAFTKVLFTESSQTRLKDGRIMVTHPRLAPPETAHKYTLPDGSLDILKPTDVILLYDASGRTLLERKRAGKPPEGFIKHSWEDEVEKLWS